MLKMIDIHTYYGESYILQGITLEVAGGTVTAILGRNGVGKTTLIRSIMGFTPIRRGRIFFKGADITRLRAYQIVRNQMAVVPQGRHIFPSLTVKENLVVATRNLTAQKWNFEKIFAFFPILKERVQHKGNELSGGEQQMLAIARALISNPEMILMDEPIEGLAPIIAEEVGEIILKLKNEGHSILIVEQSLAFALRVSSESHVMNKGRIVYSSTPKELWDNQEIKSQYLGV